MEAANKGAYEAKGTSIGLNITLPQEQEGNKYQTVALDFHYFYARKVMFVKYASAFICFPGGYGTLDEFFETITLVQTLKIEAFPIILYGSEYWNGLAQWIEKQLKPRYIDPEDSGIFRIVDSPQEAVKHVVAGVKKHWWRPLDDELRKVVKRQDVEAKSPLGESGQAAESGEGTRYGKRPKVSDRKHARSINKPTQ
jgi:uncharacterized protein (TIGR00730 family)